MANIEKRRTKDGALSYRVIVRLKGHPRQTATFTRLTDARRWGQKVEADIREGRHFGSAAAKKKTLSEMLDRYRQEVLPQKKESTASSQAIHLKWWEDELGDYTLDRLTPPC